MRHLHRLAKDGDKDVAAFLARRFRSDQSWTVRKRLVSLNLDREFLSGRDLAQALEDVDVSVRREAFRVDDDRFARLMDMGWPRFTDPEAEPDRELRSQFIARVLKLEGLSGALRRIEQHGTASSETWRALLNARMKADWDQLSFLADGNPDNESRLVDLLKTGGDEAAFGWLVRSLLEPRAIWREAIWHLVSLDAVEAPALAGVLAGLDRNDRMVVQARLLEYADEIRNYMMVEEDDDDAEWLSAVEALARTLS